PPARGDVHGEIRNNEVGGSFPGGCSDSRENPLTKTSFFWREPTRERARHNHIDCSRGNAIGCAPEQKLAKGGARGESPHGRSGQKHTNADGLPASPSIGSDPPWQL